MKRFTLIIDGHNFYFRSLWGCFKQSSKKKVLATQKDIDAYEKKMMIDFCSVIKQVNPIVNDVVFIQDSHSWRKDLLLNQEYKGNRKKTQESIDFTGFTTATNNFVTTLSNMGIKISQVERAEGDDLIYAWSNNLFQEGKSSLIFSTDKDLTQLVKCVDDVHIIQYAPLTNRLFVSEETNNVIGNLNEDKDITDVNLFDEIFTVSIENDPFKKFVNSTIVDVVKPEHVRFMKIISGDSSDNIYPVYFKPGDGTTRSKGIGEKTCQKIYDTFSGKLGCDFNYTIYSNDDAMNMLCNVIYEVAKINDEEFTKRMLHENIKTNTKLVALTNDSIPGEIIDSMSNDIEIEKAKKPVILSKITKEALFSKSRFKDYKSSIQMSSRAMKDIVDDGDMSFIKG